MIANRLAGVVILASLGLPSFTAVAKISDAAQLPSTYQRAADFFTVRRGSQTVSCSDGVAVNADRRKQLARTLKKTELDFRFPSGSSEAGLTPLILCIEAENAPMVETLLKLGADPNFTANRGGERSALYEAALFVSDRKVALRLIQQLLAHAARPEITEDCVTPLFVSISRLSEPAKTIDLQIVEALARARPDAIGLKGCGNRAIELSPLDLAKAAKQSEVEKLLRRISNRENGKVAE